MKLQKLIISTFALSAYLLAAPTSTPTTITTNNINPKEVFPSTLSSSSQITLRSHITLKNSSTITTPALEGEEYCHKRKYSVTKDTKQKEENKKDICTNETTPTLALKPFEFVATTNHSTTSTTKNQTFKKANLPSLTIDKPKLTLTFKAPKNRDGKRVQHIGAIEDSSRVSTYVFHKGDYYIDSLKLESQNSNKDDLFTIKTKGQVRIFLNKESHIIKRADNYKRRAYIELNYNKNPSDLIILSKANLTIDASRRLKAHGFIYGYEDISIISNKNSTIKGAIHSDGTLTIGKEIAKHWKQKGGGEFVYDGGVKRVDLEFEVDQNDNNNTEPDTTAPTITLNGNSNTTLNLKEEYKELGATVIDNIDTNLSVEISGEVDSATVGIYTITYSVTDSSGNIATVTRTIEVVELKLISLSLEGDTTNINLGDIVNLILVATYENNTTKNIKENIELLVTPKDSLETNGTTIVANKDGSVTLQAKVDNTLSNSLNFEIKWVVDGHTLPPEPDPTLNNSTLLGIDSNDNGVRDDVERWIYRTYKDKHPIHIDIAMQAARGYKLVLEMPERAKEIHNVVNKSLYCELYYRSCVDYINLKEKRILNEHDRIHGKFFRKKVYFNTREREREYVQYDTLLSGDSYTLIRCSKRKELCDFNTSKYEE